MRRSVRKSKAKSRATDSCGPVREMACVGCKFPAVFTVVSGRNELGACWKCAGFLRDAVRQVSGR